MNILVTAGGTREPIDAVREITNRSTGRLGRCIAEAFLAGGAAVTYVAGEGAETPAACEPLTLRRIRTVADLSAVLEERLTAEPFDAVIHGMAVSDYAPVPTTGKIPSDEETVTLTLRRLPKIIDRIKGWQPSVRLFGFKLLAAADEAALAAAAAKLFSNARCDYVLANTMAHIRGDAHPALLFKAPGTVVGRAATKHEIADLIFRRMHI